MGGFFSRFSGRSRVDLVLQAQAAADQEKARRIAQAALTAPEDSDPARVAGERRLKKLAGMRGVAGTQLGQRGGGSVARKMLMGQ
jgi:hypothetical protein